MLNITKTALTLASSGSEVNGYIIHGMNLNTRLTYTPKPPQISPRGFWLY